jgi:hypothetical protein
MPSPPKLGDAERIRAARLEALNRALNERDLDRAEWLLAEFRPKDRELLVAYVERKLVGDEGGAARLRQQLEDCWKIERGDEDEVREVERRTGRQIIARVHVPPAMTPPRPIGRAECGQAASPRERRGRHGARRQTNSRQAARDGPSDLDPPPKPRARGPRHISHALADAGFDPFERPLDRLLAGLRRHSSDAYRLVPGERGDADRWFARCPFHVDVGFTLTVTEAGDLSCRAGCPEWAIRYTLLGDPEREKAAEAAARVIVWAQNWKRSA